jgi:ubiquinone/menaquinone biosynthesis C-methylase UbiE
MIVPQLADLGARLERAGARFLDVGVGVASLALAMCREYPALQIVGLDAYEPALALARDNVARAGLGARIELRHCPVQELRDERAFELAWLPSFFIPPAELDAGLARVKAALRPGGWLVFAATGTHTGSTEATRALITELWGGAALGNEPARALLERAGFRDVRVLPGPPWAPTTLAAQVSD